MNSGGAPPKSKKKKKGIQQWKTLGIITQAMVGMSVVLELKSDAEVSGVIFESDMDMNMTLSGHGTLGARFVSQHGIASSHDELFVNGRMIRYIHIPKEVDVVNTLTNHVRRRVVGIIAHHRRALVVSGTRIFRCAARRKTQSFKELGAALSKKNARVPSDSDTKPATCASCLRHRSCACLNEHATRTSGKCS